MEKSEILKLSKEKINFEDLEKAKDFLNKNYEIAYGKYSDFELKKALEEKKPIIIKNHFIIGYEPKEKCFVDINNENIPIERMVKAIIVEEAKAENNIAIEESRDQFAIIGKIQWDERPIFSIIENLYVGQVFLPPHSVIFNFLNPTEKEKKDKIVSMLSGININIYEPENMIDNAIHEIGHLFYRDCLTREEKESFEILFKNLKPSAIYNYEWEYSDPEEVFCTIYKWYVKSILINSSFYNILEFEEPKGLKLLQDILSRISHEKQTLDIWNLNRDNIIDYVNPKYCKTTKKYLRKAGSLDRIKDIEIPREIIQDINRVQNKTEFIRLEKALIPISGNKVDFDYNKKNEIAKPLIHIDMDGVIADFDKGYKNYFGRSVKEDDQFTINQLIQTKPNFFLFLPVIEKGRELIDLLRTDYHIIFLTTPMAGIEYCKRDKIDWLNRNFGFFDIVFSDNKADYVIDDSSILIDDMKYNLGPWERAGGTAIDFNKNSIDEMIDTIKEAATGEKSKKDIKNQIANMQVESNPTEKQKEAGNYKKGEILFKKLKIMIENPKNSIRFGFDWKGRKWISRMKAAYGYIANGNNGNDGDKIDVFIGPNMNKSLAFVVNQNDSGNMFDEHKILLGCNDLEEAKSLYLSNYQKGWESRIGSIVQTNTKKIRDWIENGNLSEPYIL